MSLVNATLNPGDTVVFVGDSITANGWYLDMIAMWGSLGAGLTVVHEGLGGRRIADIEADVAGLITDHNPNVVVIEIGVNDASNPPFDPVQFRADADSINSQILAWNAATQIVWVSILCFGEHWTTAGPAFDFNNFDDEIDALNDELEGSADAVNRTYVDVRTPGATYESQFNLQFPGAASGVLTSDQLHPNATGELFMCQVAIPYFNVPRVSRLLATAR